MNRHANRAQASTQRKSNVSVGLMQKQLMLAQTELQQLRNVLFSLAKEQGRLRFHKSTLDGLNDQDGVEAVLADGVYVVTYSKKGPGLAPDPKESA